MKKLLCLLCLFAGSALAQGVGVVPILSTSGGNANLTPSTNNALTAAANITSTGTNHALYGYAMANPNASTCWIQFFNVLAASVTLGTTAPVLSIPMASTGTQTFVSPFILGTGILSAAATTTATGSSTCASGPGLTTFMN